jgi:thiamine biosynthesis lipoprotein
MKQTRLLMGMPITVEVVEPDGTPELLERVFAHFARVDDTFSTYKETSEISRLNRGALSLDACSDDVRLILALSEETKRATHGYFDIVRDGQCDPSGIVKGWAIQRSADMLRELGCANFYVEAGGDFQVAGRNHGELWKVGIRNPFNRAENVKVLALTDCGVATSGTAIRGQHIYNPHDPETPLQGIVSLTVVGPNVYEADRFATAAFAMGWDGITFLRQLPGFEAYLIDANARATYTRGFERYVLRPC